MPEMPLVWKILKQLKRNETFKKVLEVVKEVNQYRSSRNYNPFGFENLILLFLQKNLIENVNPSFSFLVGQSIKSIVEANSNYREKKSLFKTSDDKNRYIQPDIIIYEEQEIKEIYEIKVEEDGGMKFFLSKGGKIGSKVECEKGDFYRLLKIKQTFPEIKTYGIIVSIPFRGKLLELQIPQKCGKGYIKVREHIRKIDSFTFLYYFQFNLLEIYWV